MAKVQLTRISSQGTFVAADLSVTNCSPSLPSSTDQVSSLTALLELCSTDGLDCERLVVCVSRHADSIQSADLIKDLGWVGFELATLDTWTGVTGSTSEQWLMLAMDV